MTLAAQRVAEAANGATAMDWVTAVAACLAVAVSAVAAFFSYATSHAQIDADRLTAEELDKRERQAAARESMREAIRDAMDGDDVHFELAAAQLGEMLDGDDLSSFDRRQLEVSLPVVLRRVVEASE